MSYEEFLLRVVEEGIEGARHDYGRPEQRTKLEGSIEGFEACRGKSLKELAQVLADAERSSKEARSRFHEKEIPSDEYWRARCREAEIEWVANVVSAMLLNQGLEPIVNPTARGAMQAAKILGVKDQA